MAAFEKMNHNNIKAEVLFPSPYYILAVTETKVMEKFHSYGEWLRITHSL